ncbi:hypothetical protein [Curtobacterium sp. MCBD17_019]|uniref:hypothetical protein n=1 Tax=Curtobacterium sp. MCBD17_019 TaxID=2175669 RepID=UPI000DAA5982|nr:hypothetical protein [Curtobacterium sp. MCBD17_019]PZE77829.1 hypothetical protein DEI82_03255 [Curtobacterium sp. MCBD17_019]
MEASWPLWVVGGAFVLLGVIFSADPKESREFFVRQVRFLYGDRAAQRYRRLPAGLFLALALAMVGVGILFGCFAAGL